MKIWENWYERNIIRIFQHLTNWSDWCWRRFVLVTDNLHSKITNKANKVTLIMILLPTTPIGIASANICRSNDIPIETAHANDRMASSLSTLQRDYFVINRIDWFWVDLRRQESDLWLSSTVELEIFSWICDS